MKINLPLMNSVIITLNMKREFNCRQKVFSESIHKVEIPLNTSWWSVESVRTFPKLNTFYVIKFILFRFHGHSKRVYLVEEVNKNEKFSSQQSCFKVRDRIYLLFCHGEQIFVLNLKTNV